MVLYRAALMGRFDIFLMVFLQQVHSDDDTIELMFSGFGPGMRSLFKTSASFPLLNAAVRFLSQAIVEKIVIKTL